MPSYVPTAVMSTSQTHLSMTPTVSLGSRAKEGTYQEHCLLQSALRISLQVVSEAVPLVLALVPHRQSHSFITQSSSDMLVSTPGRFPLASSLLPPPQATIAYSYPQVTVSASGLLGTHTWLPYDRNINNYFTFSKDPTMGSPK